MRQRLIFIVIVATASLLHAERVATYKEYKILDSPKKFAGQNDNVDLEFYLNTIERLEKLQDEAMEIRNLYQEMIENVFGLKLTTTTTKKPDILGARGPKKAAEDWVRSSLNFDALDTQTSD